MYASMLQIHTTGNAVDFGDLLLKKFPGCFMNSTRGIIARQNAPVAEMPMDTITMRTLGNATDFGDCLSAYRKLTMNGGHVMQQEECLLVDIFITLIYNLSQWQQQEMQLILVIYLGKQLESSIIKNSWYFYCRTRCHPQIG